MHLYYGDTTRYCVYFLQIYWYCVYVNIFDLGDTSNVEWMFVKFIELK